MAWTPTDGITNYQVSTAVPAASTTTSAATPTATAGLASTTAPVKVQSATNNTANTSTAAAVNPLTSATSSVGTSLNQNRTLNNNELVSNQIANITAKDSPLMQRAASTALRNANQRGLLNSSMANEAAIGAVLDRATPIAQADAGAYTNVADRNLANNQQTAIFNAGQMQNNNQFNAGQKNQIGQFNNTQQQQNNQFNAGQVQQNSQFNANNANQTSQFNANNTNQANQFNANLAQNNNQFNASNQQQVNLQNANNALQNNQFNATEANKSSIFNASESNKVLSQFLDQSNKLQLADIEATYKTIMQSEASAGQLYQQSIRNISDILQNPDLTPEAKTAAINNQNALLKTGLALIGKMGGLNLDSILTSDTFGSGNSNTPVVPNKPAVKRSVMGDDLFANADLLSETIGLKSSYGTGLYGLTKKQQQELGDALYAGNASIINKYTGSKIDSKPNPLTQSVIDAIKGYTR